MRFVLQPNIKNIQRIRQHIVDHCPAASRPGLKTPLSVVKQCIYAIVHISEEHHAVYVGKTCQHLSTRFQQHVHAAGNSHSRRSNCRQSLYKFIQRYGFADLVVFPLELVRGTFANAAAFDAVALVREQWWYDFSCRKISVCIIANALNSGLSHFPHLSPFL